MSPSEIQRTIEQADAFYAAGRFDEAIIAYRKAIESQPGNPQAINNLGNALKESGQLPDAADCYRRAIALRPDVPELHYNLATVLADLGLFDEALREFQVCLNARPDFAPAHRNLGSALRSVGRLDEAIDYLQRGGNVSDVLYASHFLPSDDPRALFNPHRAWGEQFRPVPSMGRAPRRAAGRVRVGYVSPDFREHPVGRFMLPILEGHDRERFEIFCYTDVRFEDAITHRSRRSVDTWRSTCGLSDEQLAETISADQIDILIDLTMHMRGSRLGAFARRPASVQATYLAYCSTTGLPQMDYRLSDPYLDPPGEDEWVYTEKTIRLPRTYWCYAEPEDATSTQRRSRSGPITFGSLNSFAKVTEPLLRTWGKMLRQVDSSLILHCPEGSHRDRVVELLGVSQDRVRMESFLPLDRYLALQSEVDIALDPFPYGGGTTTCDALWSGTPVVTLRGRTAVSRGGFSILSNIGLPELVASSVEQYIQIATDLANDRERLALLHATTRERLSQSPIMNRKQFVPDFESILLQMTGGKR